MKHESEDRSLSLSQTTPGAVRAIVFIVIAELFGTSLWFSGNNAINELATLWELSTASRAWLLMAVQLGFITGTLGLAASGLADAFKAHHMFAVSALVGALANASFILLSEGLLTAIAFRFLTGIALAGVYPLGMKLVVSWAPERASTTLAWLVGALTVGTSLPFFARAIGGAKYWQEAVLVASGSALVAAVVVVGVGQGPMVKSRSGFAWGRIWSVFRVPTFRASALGYFGHMWELYAFWALVPNLLRLFIQTDQDIWIGTFLVIGIGGLGCVFGGWMSRKKGSKHVALVALIVSGTLCLVAPLLPHIPIWLAFALLLVWGLTVVADSPQFSAMSAKAAPTEVVGSALAIQNSIGFFITVFALQLTALAWPYLGEWTPLLLVPGPLFGVLALRKYRG